MKMEKVYARAKRRLNELIHGKKTYMPGHKMLKVDKSKQKSTRTKQVEGGLKKAGLSEAEIAKLKGK